MNTSQLLTIFEGCDGTGKTTAAKRYAAETGARYVHLPALPRVGSGLARLYVEAMLPALLGYQAVVMDRCWLSELPYGVAFRGGKDRLGESARRMLERLALRCGTVVVHCDPGWVAVEASFKRRKGQELLTDTTQLRLVHNLYRAQRADTALNGVTYDYQHQLAHQEPYLATFRSRPHPLALATAGSWRAPTVLVGESFGERKDQDPLYQAPFVSFNRQGCSHWLTEQLRGASVGEDELLWVNADDDLGFLRDLPQRPRIVALGETAAKALQHDTAGLACSADGTFLTTVAHPQAHKRFHAGQRYPLLNVLQKEIKNG